MAETAGGCLRTVGEAADPQLSGRFAPAGELDGSYLTLARGLADDRWRLYIWDADDFPGPPAAKVEIPAVAPHGLHANWFRREETS